MVSRGSYNFLSVPLSDDLLERFREWYSRRVLGRNTVRYTVKYVREFGWLLNADRLRFHSVLGEDSRRPYILDALSNYCKFLDDLFDTSAFSEKLRYLKRGLKRSKPKDIAEKFTGLAPKLEEIEAFYHALVEYGYTAAVDFFRTTLFSGCRPPGEARLILRRIHENKYFIVNSTAVIHVWKYTKVKNLYVSLIPTELLEILKKRRGLGKKYEVQKAWNYAREKTGLKSLRPYDLRDFYATWMRAQGLTKPDVDLLQGRIPLKSVQEHYYLDLKTPDSPYLKSLSMKYRAAMETLIPKFLR